MKNKLRETLQSQLDEIQQNKVRFALIVISLIVVTIIAVSDDSGDEEIAVDIPAQIEPVAEEYPTPIPNDNNANIKIVMGANANDLYVGDPFEMPLTDEPEPESEPEPAQVEETPPVVVTSPAQTVIQLPVDETPKPDVKIILRGIAIGENPSALIERIAESAAENLIVGIGDNLDGRTIVAITNDSVIFDNNTKMNVNTEMP